MEEDPEQPYKAFTLAPEMVYDRPRRGGQRVQIIGRRFEEFLTIRQRELLSLAANLHVGVKITRCIRLVPFTM